MFEKARKERAFSTIDEQFLLHRFTREGSTVYLICTVYVYLWLENL